MTEYSFRQEIIWPDLPEPSAADVAKFARIVDDAIRAEILRVGISERPAPVRGCGCTVMHRPGCPVAVWVT